MSTAPSPFTRPVSRRTLLAGGAATLGVGGLLSGCSDPTEDTNTGQRNASATHPTYKPVELIKPDHPGSDKLMAGYYAYPKDPKRVFDEPPAAGLDEINFMYPTFVPTPPGRDKNKFYAQLEKNIGCKMNFRTLPSGDYAAAFQTTIASGDLPDICMFPRPIADEPKVLNKLFADLGPYLSGDAAKDYPYLAAMPPYVWPSTIANGTIYAVPQPRPLAKEAIFIRVDIAEKLGADPEPKSLKEFQDLLRGVTDKKKRRWAFGNASAMVRYLQMMLGAPNAWSEEGGKFTHAYGDERTFEAVQLTADMVKEGLFHPDAASVSAKYRDMFFAGQLILHGDGSVGFDLFARSLGGPEEGAKKLGMINPPKADGGGDARHFGSDGIQDITVIRKDAGEEKIRTMLSVLNFLAAPIGSREHLERKFGVEGHDFDWVQGIPTLNETGSREFLDVQYITDAMTTIGPGAKAAVDKQYAWNKRAAKEPVPDPSVGLYSDTYSRDGSSLDEKLDSARNDVIFGRKKISDLKEAYESWRKNGGDKFAAEYAESLAAQPDR